MRKEHEAALKEASDRVLMVTKTSKGEELSEEIEALRLRHKV